jgi:hypothetical protein
MRRFLYFIFIIIILFFLWIIVLFTNHEELKKLSYRINGVSIYFKNKLEKMSNVFFQEFNERKVLAEKEVTDKKENIDKSIKNLIKSTIIKNFEKIFNENKKE